jgi:hypothetical protein
MRLSDDYRGDMRRTRVSDREIELLLSGELVESEQWSSLTPLLETMRSHWSHEPPEPDVQRFAASAASVVRALPTISTISSPGDGRWQRLGLTPRLATIAIAIALLSGTAGIALAADDAVPGDSLYGLDLALEQVGIGAGSAQERLDEAVTIAADGRSDEALIHAIEALSRQGGDASGAAASALLNVTVRLAHMQDAAEVAAAEDGVTALLTYIAENMDRGVGTDGSEFGQGVALLAREIGGGDVPSGGQNPVVAPPPGQGRPDEPGGGPSDEGTGNGGGGANQGNGPDNPGGNQNGQSDENGQDNGPPVNSPSVTAPDPGTNPPEDSPPVTAPSPGPKLPEDSPAATSPGQGNKP